MYLSLVLFLSSTVVLGSPVHDVDLSIRADDACTQIANLIPDQTFTLLKPGLLNYENDIEHWMISSQQSSACSVEPASSDEVSAIMKIVTETNTTFAIKSGGHSSNQGFSSTTGVQISMTRINQVTLSEDKKTVEVGTGNIWTDVYKALNGTGVNVVGGRVSGPGVGGFTLGGGYSWLTEQYGLTCDSANTFNVVLSNGTITTASSTTDADLFWALKGGLNKFGVVTSIVFNTVPQPDLIWGGVSLYLEDALPDLIVAVNNFQSQNTDPKAQVILTIQGGLLPSAILLQFYDGPGRPAAFEGWANITTTLSTVKTQTFADFVSSVPSQLQGGQRGAFNTLMTTNLTQGFIEAVRNESTYYSLSGVLNTGFLLSFDVEPFAFYGKHATDSAWPHSSGALPLNLYFSWELETNDEFFRDLIQNSIAHLSDVAKAEGIASDAPLYPNYALDNHSGDSLYGENAARLREIQSLYDPNGVMQVLTGGFSF